MWTLFWVQLAGEPLAPAPPARHPTPTLGRPPHGVAAAVSAAAPAPGAAAAAAAQCVLVPRTDLMGNDLLASNTSSPLPQPCPSPEACCAMCAAHDPASEPKGRCGAWSWNLQSKTCWMKTKMSDNPRTCTDTSGVLSNPSRPLGRTLLIANGSATGAVTTFGTVTKDARNPLLKIGAQREVDQDPKRPWSTGGIYSAIVADQTGKRAGKPWRAYFTAGLNWTMDPQCPPGDTCETGAAGLLYAESEDGIAWEQPNVGIMVSAATQHTMDRPTIYLPW